ncbi:MAG: hypothetical protein ACRDJC_18335 [Thermomicrobiales bacterium]
MTAGASFAPAPKLSPEVRAILADAHVPDADLFDALAGLERAGLLRPVFGRDGRTVVGFELAGLGTVRGNR